MNQHLLIRNARKKALKERLKRERELSREELLDLKISTVPLWKRTLVVLFGILIDAIAIGIFVQTDYLIFPIILLIIGSAIILAGILSCRKTVDTAVDAIGDQSIELIIQLILAPLD